MPHYHFEASEYCADCLPDVEPDLDDFSQDTPAHCCVCDKLLDCELTSHGIDYVCEYLDHAIYTGQTTDVERQWAALIAEHHLTKSQKQTLEAYRRVFQ